MLFVAPWLIKHVNGEAGLEHVPGVAGLFYSAYIAMAVYSDNVLRFRGDAEPYGRLSYAWALLLVGIAIALAPLPFDPAGDFRNQFHHVRGLGGFTQATLTTCIGLLVVALSVSRFAAYRAQRGRGGRLLCGTLVLLTAPLLTYVLLFATGKPLFELTGEFWLWLCLYSLLVGVVVLFIARPLSGKVRRGFDFLFEEHPAETFTLRLKRYSRALLFFASAWLWWNFVNAPALYGNETAKRHFATIVQGDTDGECRIEFQTAFVIAATSLDTAREVYFYAYPAKVAGDAADTAELNVRNDPRWVEFGPAVRHDDLVSIVFASGSPFPVFPMTRVSAPPLAPSCEEAGSARNYDPDRRENEWLVDGGYAHNIPIDAARQLGAERVLVVSSSPLHTDEDRGGVTTFSIGRLIIGLPRLFPYLFERSQIEDVLSTEGMLVAAISPPPTVEDWPALTDFRPARIRKVVEEARKNITMRERIGTVESWGQPLCRLGDIDVPCEALRTLGGRKTGVERRAVR
jgi:predicted acylesterase/phospholipase RssA